MYKVERIFILILHITTQFANMFTYIINCLIQLINVKSYVS